MEWRALFFEIKEEVIPWSVPGEMESSSKMFVSWDLWVVQDSKANFSGWKTWFLCPFCEKGNTESEMRIEESHTLCLCVWLDNDISSAWGWLKNVNR